MDSIEYLLLDITSDLGVPVIAAFSFGESSFGYVASMGLGCHFSPMVAIQKALLENALGRLSVIHRSRTDQMRTFKPDFSDVVSFQDHAALYSTDKSLRRHIKFIEGSKSVVEPNQVGTTRNMEQTLSLFADRELSLFAVDLTTEDVESVGFRVARVVCPELASLHGMHPYPYLRSKRIQHPESVFSWADERSFSKNDSVMSFPPHMLG